VTQAVEHLLSKHEAPSSNPSTLKNGDGEKLKRIYMHKGVLFSNTIKNLKIMSFVGKWTELENTMLCKISQTHGDKHCMFF
jgi:hypothetical protein